eukprot:23775-Chlamydomonas_euryale.AAC.2
MSIPSQHACPVHKLPAAKDPPTAHHPQPRFPANPPTPSTRHGPPSTCSRLCVSLLKTPVYTCELRHSQAPIHLPAPLPPPAYHALARVDERGVKRDDAAETLLHVANKKHAVLGRKLAGHGKAARGRLRLRLQLPLRRRCSGLRHGSSAAAAAPARQPLRP